MLVEALVLLAKPTWMAPFAFLRVREERFTIRSRRRVDDARAGYRDAARTAAALPALPARTEFGDSVLFVDGDSIALRRAYGLGRRQIWLVRVAISIAGDEVVMRAQQALVPMTLPLFVLGMTIALQPERRTPSAMLLVFPLVMLAVIGLQHLFSRASRDDALTEAFAFLEGELRRELEEPALGRAS